MVVVGGIIAVPGAVESGSKTVISLSASFSVDGTVANLRLAGVYSQASPDDWHLLQRGRSPEHFVLWE